MLRQLLDSERTRRTDAQRDLAAAAKTAWISSTAAQATICCAGPSGP